MVKGLGARVIEIEAPFDPEGGAMPAAAMPTRRPAIRTGMRGDDHAAHGHGHHSRDDHHHDDHHHDEHCDHGHITAIPCSCGSKPAAIGRSGAMQESEGRGALSADDLAVAAFPVGAFFYSSGIEWAVEAGDITRCRLVAGLAGVDAGGRIRLCDGVFLAHAHRAAATHDDAMLARSRNWRLPWCPPRAPA